MRTRPSSRSQLLYYNKRVGDAASEALLETEDEVRKRQREAHATRMMQLEARGGDWLSAERSGAGENA